MGNPSSGPHPGLQQRDAEPAAAGLGAVAGWRGQQDGAEQAGQRGLPSPRLCHAVALPWAGRRPSCCHFGCQLVMHAGLKQGEPARGLTLPLAVRLRWLAFRSKCIGRGSGPHPTGSGRCCTQASVLLPPLRAAPWLCLALVFVFA